MEQRRTFYEEQKRNRRDSILLAIVVSLVLFGLVYSFAYIFAPEDLFFVLPLSAILIVVYTWGSYQYGDQIVIAATGARPAEGNEFIYLNNVAEGLSIAAGIPMPKVYVMESPEINAFATGKDPQHSSIAVTTGALQKLNRAEIEGVVAHELSHIRNKDIQFMTYVTVLVGLVSILSSIIRRWNWTGGSRRRGRDRGGSGFEAAIMVLGLILAIIAPIAVALVQYAISRRREYMADASGAELTRYPEGLASALEKIKNFNQGKMKVDEAVSPLFISDPNHSALDNLFATHPPIEDRIQRLRQM
ncbi:TPA: M48 family metallopeptidase [Candidatus Bathyarchaeota archaeon]|nr:M48 family metallopeptidase [Candidatus Bathyarchaeota archaeon]